MDYFKSYSAQTQAAFYKAEADLIRFGERAAHMPHAEYMKNTLLGIDAVFAVRMTRNVSLPPVPLIVSYDVADWKYDGDIERCLCTTRPMLLLPDEFTDATIEAVRYMQALQWVSDIAVEGFKATPATLAQLNDILVNGKNAAELGNNKYRDAFLPYKKGSAPQDIPARMHELCDFANGDYFSPLGQASVIHHAFERIVPFDSMIDRTGLLFAFMPMFRRKLFTCGFPVPICWGASLEPEFRKTLKDASRGEENGESHIHYRERWAAYNARNTSMAVTIANMFLQKVEKLRETWRSTPGLKIPANSATDKLLDLFLAIPRLATKHAASCIGKSYGATNEALHQLVKAGIVKEVAIDNRERIFICEQSTALIEDFVLELERISKAATDTEE